MKKLVTLILILTLFNPLSVMGIDPETQFLKFNDSELDQRLHFIETRLENGKKNAIYWQYGWTGFYAIGVVAGTVQSTYAENREERINYTVSAAKSTCALMEMIFNPLPSINGAAKMKLMSIETRSDKLIKLQKSEKLLRLNVRRANIRYSWWPHLQTIAFNLAAGAIIMAYGNDDDALLSTAMGITVSEIAIWSEPYRAIQDLRDYEEKRFDNLGPNNVSWYFMLIPGGGQIQVLF